MTDMISLTIADRIATVTLSRPPVNAFNADMFKSFHGILDGLATRTDWSVLHILSNLLILAGFLLIGAAWRVLHGAQRRHRLATTGAYAYVRHPQYVGFILIMLGFVLQWPTLLTLLMFPILVVMYVHLARREEAEVAATFGASYRRYAEVTPAWLPRMTRRRPSAVG
jgi:protein-S-isoprenylcysteine O-methyltransferase Ste14